MWLLRNFFPAAILIVGPEPDSGNLGGVARHMTILKALNATKDAIYFDPGSSNGRYHWEAVISAIRCTSLGKLAKQKNAAQVWINSSIYDTGIAKLILLLFSLKQCKEQMVRVFFHGGRFSRLKWLNCGLMKDLALQAFNRADTFHFLSEEQGGDFQKTFGVDRWQLFKNFSDRTNLIERVAPRKKVFLFVGRLVKEKGIREIAAAIDLLRQIDPKTDAAGMGEFWFAGEGPETEYLHQVAERRPPGTIRLLGRLGRPQLDEAYSKAFALLLPSHLEAFPYVIIEAMQAGLPIIACPTGAIPDLIEEGENGFLVPAGNSADLAQAMRTLLEDERLWGKISKNNREYFLRYLSRSAAEKYYEGLIAERFPKGAGAL